MSKTLKELDLVIITIIYGNDDCILTDVLYDNDASLEMVETHLRRDLRSRLSKEHYESINWSSIHIER